LGAFLVEIVESLVLMHVELLASVRHLLAICGYELLVGLFVLPWFSEGTTVLHHLLHVDKAFVLELLVPCGTKRLISIWSLVPDVGLLLDLLVFIESFIVEDV
jgi:hypothetical protein